MSAGGKERGDRMDAGGSRESMDVLPHRNDMVEFKHRSTFIRMGHACGFEQGLRSVEIK